MHITSVRPPTRPRPAARVAIAMAPNAPIAPQGPVKATGELYQLRHWMVVKGAEFGAGLGLVVGGVYAIGHPIGWLMGAGLLAAMALGASICGFAGSQLGDLGEYESGRIALQHGRPH